MHVRLRHLAGTWPVAGDWDGNGTDTPGAKWANGTNADWAVSNIPPSGSPVTFTFQAAGANTTSNDLPLTWRVPPP